MVAPIPPSGKKWTRATAKSGLAALCAGGKVVLDDLQLATEAAVEGSIGNDAETLDDHVNRIEKQLILEALAKTGFNRTAAARLLGVSFRSLRYRIERLGIEE